MRTGARRIRAQGASLQREGRSRAHNSSPKPQAQVVVLQVFYKPTPGLEPGTLHYEFRAAVTTSHDESSQVTRGAKLPTCSD
jgi:hypothetical protein